MPREKVSRKKKRAEKTKSDSEMMSVQEAICKRVPFMHIDRHRDVATIKGGCPVCHSDLVCVYDDLGVTDYFDNFAHICLNPKCGFVRHKEIIGRRNRSDPKNQTCVFCDRRVKLTW